MNRQEQLSGASPEYNLGFFREWLESLKSGKIDQSLHTLDDMSLRANKAEHISSFFDDERKDVPTFFILSGASESGKSHMGKRFLDEGKGHRLKLLKAVADLQLAGVFPKMEKSDGSEDPNAFLSEMSSATPGEQDIAIQYVVNAFEQKMTETGVFMGVVETIKHPWVVEAFERNQNIRSFSLFIDAPFEVRARRESLKTGVPVEELVAQIKAKDAQKKDFGNEEIAQTADLYVVNSGELTTYDAFLDSLYQLSNRGQLSSTGRTIQYS